MDLKNYRKLIEEKEYLALFASILLIMLIIFSGSFQQGIVSENKNKSLNNSEALTEYQKDYVDCPERYLELCTKMSKIPTEEVRFERVEGDKMYLDMPRSNRSMVTKIQQGGEDGYLIQIKD